MKCDFCKKREGFRKEAWEFNICSPCWYSYPNTPNEDILTDGGKC